MLEEDVLHLAQITVEQLTSKGVMLTTAESCTGGLIVGALTSIAGSSSAVHGGFVTYSNRAKMEMLGVLEKTLDDFGAVSKQTACEMADGAARNADTEISVAVTGIAGPGGATPGKPVGLVHFACHYDGKTSHIKREFGDIGREEVREETVRVALTLVLACLDKRTHP